MNKNLKIIKALYESGLITRQAMKSIRGQVLGMSIEEGRLYIKKIIERKKEAD